MTCEAALTSALADMFNPAHLKPLRRSLLRWYDANKRDLPWRTDRDPYRVWVSEIMLQQTRVAAVIEYFQRFIRRFPDVHSLARARESSVLAQWSGLGYYRRARSFHAAARIISKESSGRFPRTSTDWLQLPGIGPYTAAAIASIAFDEPCAVVDGNVERVIRRLTGNASLGGKPLWQAAQQLLSPEHPGDYNQSVMELGATVCLPDQPVCNVCPITRWCATRGSGQRRAAAPRKRKTLSYVLSVNASSVYLVKRSAGSLMPGMWELPVAPESVTAHAAFHLRHSITDTDYSVRVFRDEYTAVPGGRWIRLSRVAGLPLTGLARKILRKAGLI